MADRDNAPDSNDTTSILQGGRAFFGKDALSAGRMATVEGPLALYMRVQQAINVKAEQARQMARLAEWNAARTVVGGVAMTNEEAQTARQHVVDHGDEYVERAVRQGLIRTDEKEEFKAAMRRKIEMEDRRGRGILTPEEEREATALDKSGMGHALDAATANAHRDFAAKHDARAERATTNDVLRNAPINAAADRAVFEDYQAATVAPASKTAPQPLAARVATVGLDL